jgi:hypothetical protein
MIFCVTWHLSSELLRYVVSSKQHLEVQATHQSAVYAAYIFWECLLHVSTFATTRVALPTIYGVLL